MSRRLWLLVLSFGLVCWYLPEPFMDERFHVNQTLRIAQGDYGWDPMITTPPGLYLFGVMMLKLFPHLKPLIALRLVSLLHAVLLDQWLVADAWMIPIVFPYCLLYYTDIPSLTWLMLSKKLMESNALLFSTLAGSVAVSLRQTNIVWLAYFQWSQRRWRHPMWLVYGCFAVFVVLNGGIACGDRTNHRACLHPAQLLYWLTMVALLRQKRVGGKQVLMVMPLAYAIARYGHQVHPYLAVFDPHHLGSWWWTRLHPTSVWWTPIYAMAIVHGQDLWHLIPPVMLTAGLSPLVEPRYFVIPTVLAGCTGKIAVNLMLLYILIRYHLIF